MFTRTIIDTFDQCLKDANPDASSQVLRLARNTFLRKYGHYAVSPEVALAVATDEELMCIRNAGKKCQQVYANTQVSLRAMLSKPVNDILELKNAMYTAVDQKTRHLSGIDRLILRCIEHGIKSKKEWDLLMPYMLAYRVEWTWECDEDVLRQIYGTIARHMHPEIKDPNAYIVRYLNEDREITYVGVDPKGGKQRLIDQLTEAGYNVNVSGRINGLPIHFMNAEKKKEEEHETNSDS